MPTLFLASPRSEFFAWLDTVNSTLFSPALAVAVLLGLGETYASGQANAPSESNDGGELMLREARAYYERGVAHIERQEWEEAVRDLSEAVRLNPEEAMAYFYRGCARFARGDMDIAATDFDQAVLLQPTNCEAIFNRGATRRAQRDFDQAISDFTECLRLNPKHAEASKNRAASYSAKGEPDKAIADWNEGLRITPNDARALVARGLALATTSQFDKALLDFKTAIRLGPTNGEGYNDLAWLRATCPRAPMRNGKEAVEAATKACSLSDWTRWEWIDTLAAACAETGDFKRAVAYQKRALAMSAVSVEDRGMMQRRLSLYEQKQPYRQGRGK